MSTRKFVRLRPLFAVIVFMASSACATEGAQTEPGRLSSAQTEGLVFSYPEPFRGDPWNPDPSAPFCPEKGVADYFYYALFDESDPGKAELAWSLLERPDVTWTFELGTPEAILRTPPLARDNLTIEVIPAEDGVVYGYVHASWFCGASESEEVTPTSLDVRFTVPGFEETSLLATAPRDPSRVYPVAWPSECGWGDQAKVITEGEDLSSAQAPPGSLTPRCSADGTPECDPYEEASSVLFLSTDPTLRQLVEEAHRGHEWTATMTIEVLGPSGAGDVHVSVVQRHVSIIETLPRLRNGTLLIVLVEDLPWDGLSPSLGTFERAWMRIHEPLSHRDFLFVSPDDPTIVTFPLGAVM